jgi:hypothetical protein
MAQALKSVAAAEAGAGSSSSSTWCTSGAASSAVLVVEMKTQLHKKRGHASALGYYILFYSWQ